MSRKPGDTSLRIDAEQGDDALPVVRFEGVSMRYGRAPETLLDIGFSLMPGSFHFLTGASGAGKSSLLKLIYLAHRASRGRVELFGRDVSLLPVGDLPFLRRRIGVVFQEFRLLEHLSVFDNAALPMRILQRKPIIPAVLSLLIVLVLAIPLFMASGAIMTAGGIARMALSRMRRRHAEQGGEFADPDAVVGAERGVTRMVQPRATACCQLLSVRARSSADLSFGTNAT